MKNIAKEKILKNELCLGVGLRQTRTADIGKIMSTCGYDWLFIDMEHNSMDID
ncbi:MAG: aldolase, partial [SAR116 cluster bacterium]|nr:aldolase [SAR116 cluster bacterium]